MRVLQVADGETGVAEIADIALGRGASVTDAADIRTRQTASEGGFLPLTVVPADAWSALAARAIEPNGYYLPAWELAVNASAPAAPAHRRSARGAMPRLPRGWSA